MPKSCCNVKNVDDCRKRPGRVIYADSMKGCFTIFAESLDGSKNTIVYVSVTIIAAMVIIFLIT